MLIGFDTETHLITDEVQAPRLVCGAFCDGNNVDLLNSEDTIAEVATILSETKDKLVIQNASFDMSVMALNCPDLIPDIFQAYEDRRILCTRLNEKLHVLKESGELEKIQCGLADLVERYLGLDIHEEKDDENSWRRRFSELEDIPIENWPTAAAEYAKSDAIFHYRVWLAQAGRFGPPLKDLYRQVYADFCLRLMTICGMHLDPKQLEKVDKETQAAIDEHMGYLIKKGIYELKAKTKPENGYKKNTAAVQRRVKACFEHEKMKAPVPLTASGKVCCNSDVMGKVYGMDPVLDKLIDITEAQSTRSKFLNGLLAAPGIVHPSYDCLKRTGRTSCRGPNIQQMPRAEGVRECFVPRPGYLFLAIDYSTIELCSLSYVIKEKLGIEGEMWKAINAGQDCHLRTAATITGRDYEDMVANKKDPTVKMYRQMSKAANFGYPGGLGAETFITFARGGYGVILSLAEAQKVKNDWLETYPEMVKYFKFINDLNDGNGNYVVEQANTDRVRAGCHFCSACNTYFQGLTADGAKQGIIDCSKACYTDESSPAYGCAPVAFIHDEILFEIPEEGGPERWTAITDELSRIMVEGMKPVMPGIRVEVEPSLMRRWSKKADPVYKDGFIQIWEK